MHLHWGGDYNRNHQAVLTPPENHAQNLSALEYLEEDTELHVIRGDKCMWQRM